MIINTYTPKPIFIMCLSRGRPSRLNDTIKSWRQTESGISDFFVVLDEDDQHNYDRVPGINYIVHPKDKYVNIMNHVSDFALKSYPYVCIASDDIIYQTPNWDSVFYKQAEKMNGWCILYGDDTVQRAELPTHPFIGTKVIRSLGYLAYPGLLHFYHDNVWKEIGIATNILKYMPEIITEHMHCNAGKALSDSTYNNAHIYDDHDESSFKDWLLYQKQHDINNLIVCKTNNTACGNINK